MPPFALVGLHACDAAAVAYLDRFFAGDPHYELRRSRALLVGVDCTAACAGGFCVDVDAGPFVGTGCDLVLTPLPDGAVYVDVATDAGVRALRAARVASRPAHADDVAVRAAVATRARASFAARPYVDRSIARVDARAVADDEWQALGPWCFACTGCTRVCPTCSCFTVVDEASADAGTRVREWDSCLLEGFQREASGHHPSPRVGDRVRRFWSHKLSHDFVARCGRIGCVGCGRCDVTCPGAIGARHVLERLGAP